MKELNSGTVARYCKPSLLENFYPTSSSFTLRKERNEKFLSVFLLEFFNKEQEIDNVREVKKEMQNRNFKISNKGSFAILDIESSKKYITQKISEQISYKELNLLHCGIFHDYDDLVISELLLQCVKNNYLSEHL